MTYRGRGIYRKQVTVAKKTNLRFVFKGVSHTADVYFNGKQIAHHYNAYTAFEVVVKEVASGSHELEVRVDNGFHEGSSLHLHNDYYTYGGIIRPVAMEEVADLYIQRIEFTPIYEKGSWKAGIRLNIVNLSDQEQEFVLNGKLAGLSLSMGCHRIAASHEQQTVMYQFDIPDVDAWSR